MFPDLAHMRAPSRRNARSSRAARCAGLALALVLLAAGCGGVAGTTGTGTSGGAAGGGLADLTRAADPRAVTGPSTAVLADAAITPISADAVSRLPVTVTDMQGTKVTIDDASRVLALDVYGSLSRIVFQLGLGDRLVGRDVSTAFDEAAHLPLVTHNGHELNGEAILGLAPSVILTDTSLGPWDVVLQLRDAGIPVVVLSPERDLDAAGTLIREVAGALGVATLGEELATRTEVEVAAKVAEIAEITPAEPLRMAFLYVRGTAGVYSLFGRGSGADSLITALGGADVAGEIGWEGMRPVNDEGIIAAQPELLLVMSKGLASAGGVDGLLERLPALAQTPAGQRRRVVDMADSDILSFGPNTADVLDALARAIYAPEATP